MTKIIASEQKCEQRRITRITHSGRGVSEPFELSEVPDFLVKLVGRRRLKSVAALAVWRPRRD